MTVWPYTTTAVKHYSFNGMRIAINKGGVLSYVHSDHLGSSSVETNSSGASTAARTYYAYGSTRSSSGTLQTDRTYTGQKEDSTGLMYYNARYYDPSLGVFLSPDTLVPDPSLVIDYNRFLYVRANPLKYNDPSGHCPVCIILIAGLAATVMEGSAASMPAGGYTRSPGANLPPYRQGAEEVNQNRATIESLATDQVPGILLAASIANQGNTYQRPFGWDGGEFVQVFVDPDPSIGIGQIRPGEARGLGYKGWTISLLDDKTSIQLLGAKLEATTNSLSEFNLDPTESFVLAAIGNNIGATVADRYRSLPRNNQSVGSLLESYPDARTQLLKMMNWMEYLHANHGWSFPEDVDTDRVWQMLQNSYSQ